MAEMKQPKTDYGTKGETGEREPKGSKASDSGGERGARILNGVGMGKEDSTGSREGGHLGKHEGLVGEYNEGRKESVCYTHDRKSYQREDRSEGQKK